MENSAEIRAVSTAKITVFEEADGAGTAEAEEAPVSARSAHPHPGWPGILAQPPGPAAIDDVQQSHGAAASIGASIWQPGPASAGNGTAMAIARMAASSRRTMIIPSLGSTMPTQEKRYNLPALLMGPSFAAASFLRGLTAKVRPARRASFGAVRALTAWAGINLDMSRVKQVEVKLREADRRKDVPRHAGTGHDRIEPRHLQVLERELRIGASG